MDAFADPSTFVTLGRLTALALSPDGTRLVAVRQEPDAKGRRYAGALWSIDPAGTAGAARLTRSEQGENSPAFRPDNGLLFCSSRPDPDGGEGEAAIWELPTWGEPRVVARASGGLSAPLVAAGTGSLFALGSRLAGGHDDDRAARTDRDERGLNHVLHTGFPIRYWDSELNTDAPRLFALDGAEARDLLGDTGAALTNAGLSVDAAGTTLATTWQVPLRGGRTGYRLALVDAASGKVTPLPCDDGYGYDAPRLSPDGRWLAVTRDRLGDHHTPLRRDLLVLDVSAGPDAAAEPVRLDVGDAWVGELAWSGDSSTLVVAGDRHGRGVVLAATAGDWNPRILADDAAYSSLCVDHTGAAVYALRATYALPPHPVRLAADGTRTDLRAPDPAPALPGTLTEVSATAPDGTPVRAWLCLPHGASPDEPAPVQLWIHGGPFMSANAWSWRWCPWLAVSRGYAVLLPDPALSTGYGDAFIDRAWPHRAAVVWGDLEAVLDEALRRDDLDAGRVALLGASFGGYMTNWIAGHTDRFAAIVTHAGLWALDQQHTTTDAAEWKTRLFGTPERYPDWYAENSPNRFVDAIRTPMLVVHGNRDYRVPVSEALRLWWDLVSRYDGEPDTMPHRFLNFTGENHWILSPGNAVTWYTTVLDFVDTHVHSRTGAAD
jgi:dipeptidyl aminopeptidase/acylaminoacyl peptidase